MPFHCIKIQAPDYDVVINWRKKLTETASPVKKLKIALFLNCDFSGVDLSGTEFIGCQFYDRENQKGCNFSRAMLKDAIFKSCDLSMADFRNASALDIEIRHCRAQGADFLQCKLYEYDHHAHLVLQRIYH